MGRRRGRRDNGLDAADFAAVGDLDPRIGEHLLDLLGAHGIAAYLQPSVDVNPVTRNSTMPDRPVDRLFADRAHLRTARDYLRQLTADETTFGHDRPGAYHTPTSPPPAGGDEGSDRENPPSTAPPPPARPDQFDATFAGIVAGFDRPVDPTSAPWPSAENVPEPDPPLPAGAGPVDARHLTEASLLGGVDTSGDARPEGDEPPEQGEGRFVPPPPPPLPRLSRQAVLGGLAVVVGLVLLLAPGVGPLNRADAILLGFATVVGGAVALILRLRPGTDPEERPDDGAQV